MIEIADGVYKITQNSTISRMASNDQTLITQGENSYIRLCDGYYADSELIEIDINNPNLEKYDLKEETKNLIESLLEKSKSTDEITLTELKVYIVKNESTVVNSLRGTLSVEYPVVNDQVMYSMVTNEKVIRSESEEFQRFGQTLLKNVFNLIGNTIASLNPFSNGVASFAQLFPSKYNEVRTYVNWTNGIKLHEEKVVQTSWVYVLDSPYLGAQTQFTTVWYDTIISTPSKTTVDKTDFVYYRTPNYQHPEEIARKNYGNTWVEIIESYTIEGVKFSSLI